MTENPNRHIKPGTLTLANPFPGLRAFSTDESHLFFGREGQCEIVLQYLALNRFAAVTGASGSGKSSLIYCGLILRFMWLNNKCRFKMENNNHSPRHSPVKPRDAIALSEKDEKLQA
jgi:hypothetical protein